MPLTTRTTPSTEAVTGQGRETVGAMSTVAEQPPWEPAARERPTWGLDESDPIAQGRTVLRRLGGGRRYEVFLVWDEHRLSVLVAKVLRPDQAASPAAKADLRHEADVLARLGHPVVVRGFDASVDGTFPHLLLEHLEGPTLQSLLERHGPLGLEQLLPLGLHVASALHYTAGEGFVHLDVKPENLVMGAPPRVIDFSVARSLEAAAKIARPIGTDAYMAPEQCGAGGDGVAPIGPPADVFGLGATLQYAMTGARAFRREHAARPRGADRSDARVQARGPADRGRGRPRARAGRRRAAAPARADPARLAAQALGDRGRSAEL